MKLIGRFTVRTVLPAALAPLNRLATNLRWSWTPSTQALFEEMDPDLWAKVHGDPVALLGALTPERLEELSHDTAFCDRVRVEADALDRYLTEPRWYQTAGRAPAAAAAPALQAAQAMQGATAQTPAPGADAQELPTRIAYFSPEFGITAALPQYSGGLGILAGDHLKSASDLGVPIVGVGLLYRSGYFKQALTREGWQSETYPVMDPDDLPLTLLRETDGTPAIVRLKLPENRTLAARVWRADVGRVPLLLLDSNVPENDIPERTVTDRLYGGGEDHRLLQELLLGIGGVRAIRLWQRIDGGEAPEVFHMNEGHAGFLAVERISELTAQGLSFDEALEAVRGSTVFTTHTPVPAGIDRFKAEQIRRQFSGDLQIPGVDVERILQLGAEDYQGGTPGVFNMAVMGLRVGGRCNGVSQLHGKVSRAMFKGLWSGFDLREVPISSVTNGVHVPTWIDDELAQIEAEHLGVPMDSSRWLDPLVVSDQELWSWKRAARARLVDYARDKVRRSWLRRGASPAELGWIDEALSPDVLTIGFARRVPTYKRLTLMLRDPERLTRLLTDPDHPIQILIAGKSHPNDEQGKLLIQELVRFADAPEVRNRIVFLPNYDIAMAQYLFPGCDVWLNNPLRPLEACGTSGMKAAVNGGLNCSILDGWWDEWYDGANGWAIPTADGVQDPDRRDDLEAAALYDLIEGQIAPHFYTRDDRGIPVAWLEMVRHTLATLVPKVQATRMVTDYVTQLYTPAAQMGRRLAAQGCAGAKDLAGWKARVRAAWPEVRVESVATAGVGEVVQVGDVMSFDVEVALGGLTPDDVAVEVVYGRANERDDLDRFHVAHLEAAGEGDGGARRFRGQIRLDRSGSFGYGVRVVPRHALLARDTDLALVANA